MLRRQAPFCLLALLFFLDATISLPLAEEAAMSPGVGVGAADPREWNRRAPGFAGSPAMASDAGEDVDATIPSQLTMFGYGCSRYPTGPPVEDLNNLKEHAVIDPHPMLMLSEMAESRHRHIVCKNVPEGPISQQAEEDVVKKVTKEMLGYLNANVPQKSQDPCPSIYNITFYPKRYPRYLVEVVCSELAEDRVSDCAHCSSCFKYFGQRMMLYLTSDLNDSLCTSSPDHPWQLCEQRVGMGCSCSSE